MKIKTVLESRQSLVEQQLAQGRQLVESVVVDLTAEQRLVVEGIYNDLEPLIEASLTADQIKGIFGAVEANKGNRTLLGKGVDTARQVNDVVNKVGKWLQDTKEVEFFDQKFEDLKKKVAAKLGNDSKIMSTVAKMGDFAKNNPGKTAAIIGVMTSLAALAGGPVGGAIAGQILKGTTELLKGEKLSTAVGRGMKAAAYGWLAGKSFELIGDAIKGSIDLAASAFDPDVKFLDLTYVGSHIDNTTFKELKLYGRAEDLTKVKGVFDQAGDAWRAGDYGQAESLFNQASTMADRLNSMEYISKLVPEIERADAIYAAGENAGTLFKGLGAAAQGAATGATGVPKKGEQPKESVYLQTRPLSEGQVYLLIARVCSLNESLEEAPGILSKAAGAIGGAIKKVGSKLTNKTTADTLTAAWTKAGSPTDSDAVYNFLKDQGVAPEVINSAYDSMKLPTPAQSDNYDDATDSAPEQDAGADQSAGATADNATASDEPVSIGGQKLNPKDPKQAAVIKKAQQAAGSGPVDLNTLASEIKKAGDEVTNKVKVALTKRMNPAKAQA